MPSRRRLFVACVGLVSSSLAGAQTTRGGFIARLGADTVHIERFERTGNRFSGTVLQRTPTYRAVRWTMTVDEIGRAHV